MKILIISHGYPTKREPQFGCFERDQAFALKKEGHEVSILYIDGRFRSYSRKIGITHIKDNGINVYGIYWLPLVFVDIFSHDLTSKIKFIMLDKVFKHMLKIEGLPDIIYAHFQFNIAIATFLKEKYCLPLVGMEHWSVLNKKELPIYIKKQGQLAYKKADKIIAVSNSLQNKIYEHYQHHSIVVHNMVGEDFFNIPIIDARKRDKIVLISTGSLITRKGYDVLIKALSKIASQLGNWELRLIGDGPERGNLQQMIEAYHLKNNIQLLGRKNKQEITSLLQESDFFVFPSRMENFSVAVLEALSIGLPVVATICGGIKECIDDKNGILVPVDDVDTLANGILKMNKNLRRYNRKDIAQDCKNKFSPEVIVKQLSSIFEEVVSNHKAKQ